MLPNNKLHEEKRRGSDDDDFKMLEYVRQGLVYYSPCFLFVASLSILATLSLSFDNLFCLFKLDAGNTQISISSGTC